MQTTLEGWLLYFPLFDSGLFSVIIQSLNFGFIKYIWNQPTKNSAS
jgi:hypothetical protein